MKWGLLFTIMSVLGFSSAALGEDLRQRAIDARAEAESVRQNLDTLQDLERFILQELQPVRNKQPRIEAMMDPCGEGRYEGLEEIKIERGLVEDMVWTIDDQLSRADDALYAGDRHFARGEYSEAIGQYQRAKSFSEESATTMRLLNPVKFFDYRRAIEDAEEWYSHRQWLKYRGECPQLASNQHSLPEPILEVIGDDVMSHVVMSYGQ
jgi:hypothetical protein